MIVLLALGGVFLDAYDLTTLSYGLQDVAKEFHLGSVLTGIVASAIVVGTFVGNLLGGWLTDKFGRYSIFMADMAFFVVSAIAAGLAPDVWVLIAARFLMGLGVGVDLPVAMSYLAEFSKFSGKGNKASRLAAWNPMWYLAATTCFLVIFCFYFLLPAQHIDWLWRASLIFGAVPALIIISVRSRFMNESPLWAANQGDFNKAADILTHSYGIKAHAAPQQEEAISGRTFEETGYSTETNTHSAISTKKVEIRQLFQPPYRQRTIVAAVMSFCISFEYTAINFFLPSILTEFLHVGVFGTITASLVLTALFGIPAAFLGMRLAWKCRTRSIAIVGFGLQFISFIGLAIVGQPHSETGTIIALILLGLWLFAEGFGPGAQMMVYPALSYPTGIRATGVGFARAFTCVAAGVALFILPMVQAAMGTNMFWVVSPVTIIPIIFLLVVKFEPTENDVDMTD